MVELGRNAFSVSEEPPTSTVADSLESALLKTLRAGLPQAANEGFVLAARSADGVLIGGLVGNTSYGWLLIKILWVERACRRAGVGRQLMQRGEDKARDLGCHAAWLDTSSPGAMCFYRQLNYEIFAELGNSAGQNPPGHRRWFMKKPLARHTYHDRADAVSPKCF